MTPSPHWPLTPAEVFATGPIVPVLVIHNIAHAVPIAEALIEGGINTLEVTLRTPDALAVIETLATTFPQALIGAGTVTNADNLKSATDAGAQFIISPGLTPALLDAACNQHAPLIPGISTISEMMLGLDYGLSHFKFFPAEASGGIKMLKSFAGPFPHITFCPTGGINASNAIDYLMQSNVACIGGSWLLTEDIVRDRNWKEITRLSRAIVDQVTD